MTRRAPWLMAILLALLTWLGPKPAQALQGCTLRNPDRDIRRLFPQASDYRTAFISVQDRGGATMQATLAKRLGETLDPVYEAVDIPYAYYQVLSGAKTIGYVFGVNQKGRYGGMQLILATDPGGRILHFYYQKLSTTDRASFTTPLFTDQFKGLTLADFYYHRGYQRLGLKRAEDKVAAIHPPADSPAAKFDFQASLRGVMKNLILFDLFYLKDANSKVFAEVERIVQQKRGMKP